MQHAKRRGVARSRRRTIPVPVRQDRPIAPWGLRRRPSTAAVQPLCGEPWRAHAKGRRITAPPGRRFRRWAAAGERTQLSMSATRARSSASSLLVAAILDLAKSSMA